MVHSLTLAKAVFATSCRFPSFIYFKDLQGDFKSIERWNLRAVSDLFSFVTFIGIAVGSPG